MSEAASLRRYYLLQRIGATLVDQLAVAGVWQAKQEAAPAGVALPDDFPSVTALRAVGYEASEDLVGADFVELGRTAGISSRESADVFAALAEL